MRKRATPKNATGQGHSVSLKRRDFFKLLGGGIILYYSTWDPSELLALPLAQRRSLPADYNAFLLIKEDGTVNNYTGKIEMGQGVITSLAQQMADELDVTFESIHMVMGDTALCPWDAGTWGSLTTRQFSHYMCAAAAEARAVLLEMGSEHLGLPLDELRVKEGVIYGISDPGKNVSYGELAKGKRLERYLEVKPAVKKYTEYHYVGDSMRHTDAWEKVTGKARYAGDMKLPGMLHARILRPPSLGATLVSVDTSEAEKMEGVQVLRDGDLVAALHEQPDMAAVAVVRIKAEYSFDEKDVNQDTIFKYLLDAPSSGREVARSGDLKEGENMSDMVIESEFHDGYVAHAPIEPHTALAHVESNGVTVWASTQSPFGTQDSIAALLDLELEQVRVITPFVGGGFGGKSPHQQAVEAVRLSKITGKPVMVAWTREEEFMYDTYRPAAVVRIRSGMTRSGKITMWDFSQYFAGSRGSDTIYAVPHALTMGYDESRGGPRVHPFATGAWRAPGNNTNTFARESQIDMMAARAGKDPLQFRLDNLEDQQMIGVLKAVADKFGYSPAAGPSGRGIGIACGIDAGTYVAHIAQVQVDEETGKVKVIRVACAQDMGLCVNPQGAILQMESCITMGMGYALSEDIEYEGGKLFTKNFDSYQIPLFSWVPEIETVILDRQHMPPQGGGEPAIICMGGVIANAIFDATGARLYQMPMTPQRVLEAIGKAKEI
ncbi:MAG TPA: isoquinoline 1-oxidoreductase [Bacteroides sp.]|nr:isoquinoline 1-oxidoreductase [Bacteroides sp.]